MSDPLEVFLQCIAAGDDARTEDATLALKPLGDVTLPTLRELLADPDVDRRWWSARALAALDTPAARELLIATLDDPDRDVRACAVYGLGELQAEEAVPVLVGRLADASPLVCRVAADSLARIGAPAAPTLIAALGEGETLTRIGAARALSIIQPKEAIPVLFAALDDPSATVTYYAEQALERMGVGLVLFRP
jgi:HEAT repeat protein